MRKPKRLPPEELAPYQWTPPGDAGFRLWGTGTEQTVIEPIDWTTLFGNANPVEVEVGFGKGMFLVTSGITRPETNFFGIEIIRKYELMATTRIAKRKLANVRTTCADAKAVFERHIVPASVAAVHIYFPDPWWKEKHRKRLLMTIEFCMLIRTVLKPGGLLHFATDVPDYFAWVQETLASIASLEYLGAPKEAEPEPTHDMDYLTNFERRFRKLGKPIHRADYAAV